MTTNSVTEDSVASEKEGVDGSHSSPPPAPSAEAGPKGKGLFRLPSFERAYQDDQAIKPHSRDEYVKLFKKGVQATAEATLAMCRIVYEANRTLDEAEFEALCREIGYKDTSSTIRKYIAIGKVQPRLAKHAELLPSSWTSIYQITQIPASLFERMLAQHKSLADFKGKEIRELTDRTRDISSIADELSRDTKTKALVVAKVTFTRGTIDDNDWMLMRKGFAALEARLPLKFTVAEQGEVVYQERKELGYDRVKKATIKDSLDPDDWGLGDLPAPQAKTPAEPTK